MEVELGDEVGTLSYTVFDLFVVELDGFLEDLWIWDEGGVGA